MAFWLMERLSEPRSVLAHWGVTKEALVRYLVAAYPASEWSRWPLIAPVPEALVTLIGPGGLSWMGPAPMPAMPWQPISLGCGLHLENTEGPLLILEGLRWQGTLLLRNCRNLGAIQLQGGGSLVIEACPGLQSVEIRGGTLRVALQCCPDLESVNLAEVGAPSSDWTPPSPEDLTEELHLGDFLEPDQGLILADCPKVILLKMGAGDLDLQRCQALTTLHKPGPGNVKLWDCSSLSSLRLGAGSLHLRGCPALVSLRKPEPGSIRIWNCNNLAKIRMGQGGLTVAGVAALQEILKAGSGPCHIQDCPSLTLLETQFTKHSEMASSFQVDSCPNLQAIRVQTTSLRHCARFQLLDCPRLQGPLPHLRVKGTIRILGCPGISPHEMTGKGTLP
jgi:hypothetical protein